MKINSNDLYELSEKEMATIEGGSFWRWLGENAAAIAVGILVGMTAGVALR